MCKISNQSKSTRKSALERQIIPGKSPNRKGQVSPQPSIPILIYAFICLLIFVFIYLFISVFIYLVKRIIWLKELFLPPWTKLH